MTRFTLTFALIALGACRGGSDDATDPAESSEPTATNTPDPQTTPDTTDTDTDTTPDTTDTDTDTTTAPDTGLGVAFEEAPPNLTLASLVVECGTDAAALWAEFLGEADHLEAEPWLAGQAGDVVVLDIDLRTLFHDARSDEVPMSADDCADTTWVWTLSTSTTSVCKVQGPDAAEMIATSHPDCERQ